MDKALSMLGIAKRAGALLVGTNSVLDGIKLKKTKLVIIASDAAENTLKRITDKCNYYNAEYEQFCYTMEELGSAVGKEQSSAVAITDNNLLIGFRKSHNSVE